jgi:hypothetical protein
MANAMLDARHDGDSYRRIEVITGKRRRRTGRRRRRPGSSRRALKRGPSFPKWRDAMVSCAAFSRCGDTSLPRPPPPRWPASCRSGSMLGVISGRAVSETACRQRRPSCRRRHRSWPSSAARSRSS